MREGQQHRTKYYGVDAIRRNLLPFLLGRGFSSISALLVLLLAIRYLAVAEFAIYTSLHALVFMIGVLSSFGVNSLLLRYLPDLRAQANNRAMYRLLAWGIAIRAATYGFVVLMLLLAAGLLATWLNLGEWQWVLPWYLFVGFFRINATFTVRALESLLWQRAAQYSVAAAGMLKLIAVIGVVWLDELDLGTYVVIELASESLTVALLLISAAYHWRKDPDRSMGDAAVLATDRGRYARFAFWNYTQNLTSIFYGSAPNRLIVAYFLPTETLAIFGVIDRLLDYLRRYEPSTTFVGFIRPVFNARYRTKSDFPALVGLGDFLYRMNLVVVLVPFISVAIAGDALFDLMTGGKYSGITLLFLGFCSVTILGTATVIVDILVKAIEETRIFTLSNLALSGSIAIGIPLFSYFGLWALVIANGIGLVASFVIILSYVRRRGFVISPDWSLLGLLASYAALAIVGGRLSVRLAGSPFAGLAVGCLIFFGIMFLRPPLRGGERARVKDLLRAKRGGGTDHAA